jgi:hypothetical protein
MKSTRKFDKKCPLLQNLILFKLTLPEQLGNWLIKITFGPNLKQKHYKKLQNF